MKKIKNFIYIILILAAMGFYVLYPFRCTDLHIKIYLTEDSAYTDFSVYYTTADAPVFHGEHLIHANTEEFMADILLPKELCKNLTGLRLDLSHADSPISIKRVELCSGGFIRRTFDGSDFMNAAYIAGSNDIASIQQVFETAYLSTSGNDPYIIFSPEMVKTGNEAFSHYTGTKLFLCLFIIATVFLARRKLFTAGL